ncbi:MAG TPA: hypothetical protein VFP35_01785 [Candidatus Saccharimonadales bacterium]|nr:hypothetical protein [Candidatus Saccharimonadales bacterium]
MGYQIAWKFTLIGAVSMAAQLELQHLEIHRGWNIFWWSFLQGSLLANAGMVVNCQWTFKERQIPWPWAFLLWNLQKLPHSAISMVLFGSLLQVPGLPYWCATLTTTALVGVGSLKLTDWWTGETARLDHWAAALAASLMIWASRPMKAPAA